MATPATIDATSTTTIPIATATMTDHIVPTAGGEAEPAAVVGTDVDDGPAPALAGTESSASVDMADVVDPAARRRRRRWWLIGSMLVVTAVLAAVLFVPLPYYLLQPGSVRGAEPLVSIEGAPTFEHPGEVFFTTVYIDQATLGLLLRGAIDDAIEVRTEDEVYGREGRTGSQQVNQQRMDLSKLVATKVALEYLGYPAALSGSGARVLGLSPQSTSEGRIAVGDVIVGVDGAPIRLPSDIGVALGDRRPGDVVPVVIRPAAAGQPEQTVEVTLAASPTDPQRPILGVEVDVVDPVIDSPVTVSIDSGDVTGPSAGLAWSLAVIDRLVEPSLTDGRDVAVTGEILADGSVGAIGGIAQKVAAVKRAGVQTFLYPAATPPAEIEEIERIAGDELELRPVRTLDEAVEILHPGGVRPPPA